jgi:hypothetical protein
LPGGVLAQLYRNGQPQGSAVTLNAANLWTHTWDGLNAGDTWTVDEIDVPGGYEKTISGSASTGFVITNSKNPGLDLTPTPTPVRTPTPRPGGGGESTPTPPPAFDMIVTKVWADDGNTGGTRPAAITVNLYRKATTETSYPSLPYRSVTMNGNRDVWTYTFTGLPQSENRVQYDYLVREALPTGYWVSYANNGAQSWTLTNTLGEEPLATPFATPTIPAGGGRITRQPVGMRFVDGEWVYLDENDMPLGTSPLTGDNSNWLLWIVAAAVPLLGLGAAIVDVRHRKRKAGNRIRREKGM